MNNLKRNPDIDVIFPNMANHKKTQQITTVSSSFSLSPLCVAASCVRKGVKEFQQGFIMHCKEPLLKIRK
jgi:hypothetical protein